MNFEIESKILILMFTVVQCFCHSDFSAGEAEGFCLASSTKKDCQENSGKSSDLRIPPSWVAYLHSYEEAKLKSTKLCKGTTEIEGVPVFCRFAKTIQDDLKVFNKIRQVFIFILLINWI